MADYKTPQWLLPNEKNLAYPASGDGITGSGLSEDRHSLYSMDFDGTDDYIDCGTSSELEITGDVTISAWVYITTGSAYQGIVCKRDSGGTNYQLYTDNSATPLLRFYDGATATSSTGTVSLNAWHHVAITVDSGVTNGSIFYIDGVASGTATFTITSDDANLLIGALDTGSIGSYFNGKIDEVSIWNKALNQSEIDALSVANAPANLMALSAKPIAYYPLGEQAQMGYSNWNFPNGSLQSHVVDFDGSSNITLPDIPFLRGGGQNFSVSAWVNTTSGTQVAYFGSRVAPSSTNTIYFWRNVPGGVVLNINNSSTGNIEARSSVTLSNNEWHHVAATFDGSEPVATDRIKIYIDGVLSVGYQAGTGTNLPSGTTGVFNFIGALNIGLNQTGEMSNVAIWDSTLIGSEITTLYNNGVPYAGTQPQSANLQGWWKLNAADSSYVYPWSLELNGSPDVGGSGDHAKVVSNALQVQDINTTGTGGKVDFLTREITGAYSGINVTGEFIVYAASSGQSGATLYYKIDGGNWVQFQQELRTDNTVTTYAISGASGLTSTTSFQVKIEFETGNLGTPYVTLNNISIGGLYTEDFTNQDGAGWDIDVYTPPPVDWTFIDSSGSNNGTSNTLPTSALTPSDLQFESPYSNYSLSFNGINTKLSFSDITLASSYTLSAWVKRTSSSNNEFLFGNGATFGYGAYFNGTTAIYFKQDSGNTAFNNSAITTALARTDWVNWMFIKDSTAGTIAIYVDGTLAQSVTSALGMTSINTIGGDGTAATSYIWNGNIDEVAIWDTALTQAQVIQVYNNGYPNDLTSLSPSQWWRLGEDAYFVSNVITIPNKITGGKTGTGSGTQTAFLVGEAPGSYSNGLGSSLDVFDRIGDAPESTTNSVSINMIPSNRISYPAAYVPTRVDNAFSMAFDGVNDYFSINSSGALDTFHANPFSISLWFKYTGGTRVLVTKQETASASTQVVYIYTNAGNILWYGGGVSPSATSSGGLSDGNWHHVVFVAESDTVARIYIDGVDDTADIAKDRIGTGSNTGSIILGTNYNKDNFFFNGSMDEVAIFDYALSERQIKQDIYNGTTPGKTADLNNISNLTAPVAWYRMGD